MRLSAMEGVSGRRSALTFHEEARGNGLGGLRNVLAIGDRSQRTPEEATETSRVHSHPSA